MAFGIKREHLIQWKREVLSGEIAFLTHYWHDERFPEYHSVTKVGCNDVSKLKRWGNKYGLDAKWIHDGEYPHFDLIGRRQFDILLNEGLTDHIEQFNLIANLQMIKMVKMKK